MATDCAEARSLMQIEVVMVTVAVMIADTPDCISVPALAFAVTVTVSRGNVIVSFTVIVEAGIVIADGQ